MIAGTWIEQHSKQNSLNSTLLFTVPNSLRTLKEREETAVFAGKDTVETVMRDITTLNTVMTARSLLFNRLFNPCSMTKSRWNAVENNEKP